VGSIIERNGRWRAQVRRQGSRPQCKTFATKAAAERWARKVEADIEAGRDGGMLGALTIGDVILAYRKLREQARPIRDDSSEHYTLKALERGLGTLELAKAGPDDLVGYATKRRDEGAGPYTVNMDVSKLGTVLRYGGAALRISPPDLVGASRPLLSHLRLIGGGGKRERRPTDDELTRIVAHLGQHYGPVYAELVLFAAASAMRRGEIVALEWAHVDEATRCATVERKHPRKGKVSEKVPLLEPAWTILQRQPRDDARCFPVHESTVSKYFTWTCRDLGIPDLHLHDMRHEGTSRLFEQGLSMQQVALVTGHKTWGNLKRYTQLRPEDLTRPAPALGPDTRPRPEHPQSDSDPRGTS
jgi:integrase